MESVDGAKARQGGAVTRRQLIAGFLGAMALFAVAFYLLPGYRVLLWLAIGALGAGAIALGVRLHRPVRRSAWWLIVVALLVLTVGEVSHFVETVAFRGTPFPSVADLIYLAGFVPLLIIGVWRLSRSGAPGVDRAGLLDTFIVATTAAVLSWAFLISPLVLGNTYTTVEKAVAVGYSVSGVLVLAAMVRLAVAVRWTPAVLLPVVGTLGLLGAGATYGLLQLQPGWRVGGLVALGWILLFAGWGAGALHPSMADLSAPRVVRAPELTRGRLVVLAVVALLAPLALLAEATRGTPPDNTVRRALIVALFVLVLARLYTAVDQQLRGAARERGLRRTGASMVEATTEDEVVAAARSAVDAVFPPGAVHEVVVEIGGAVLPAGGDGPPGGAMAAAEGTAAVSDAAGSIHLLESLAGRYGLPEAVLRCELEVPHGNSANGHLGALYVCADRSVLLEVEASVQVVASQAALALERIRLTEEVQRRANEEYFRTLVHNAADVILIVDDDDAVRFASPSAASVLGTERPGRLHDLVVAEEHDCLDRTLRALQRDPEVPITRNWTLVAVGGRRLHAEAVCRNLRADHTVAGIVITLHDVTEQRRLQEELIHLAFHDPLTGLANRALLQQELERALARAQVDGTVVGMLLLDVDDLKVVNDTLGHPVGDELLLATGKRLAAALRRQDVAARVGGDEFAALIVGAPSTQEVERVAQRVVASYAEPFALAGHLISGAVSVGVATSADAGDPEELMRQADLALYVAKSAGKAQWRRYGGPAPPPQVLHEPAPPGAAPMGPPFEPAAGVGTRQRLELVTRATGLIVPVGSWVVENELAEAAARRYPATLSGRPRLRIDVSAGERGRASALATITSGLAEPGSPAPGLVRLTDRPAAGPDTHPGILRVVAESIIETDVWRHLRRLLVPDDAGQR